MRHLPKILLLLLSVIWLISCVSKETNANPGTQNEKATVVYIVRHAEKSTNHPNDPDLSAAGKARAEALKELLLNKEISAIYSTNYKRTKQTAEPLAKARNLAMQPYDADDYGAITDKILKENRNRPVLVIGHSNSVLELIEAFKAQRPVPAITDSDYNYLFKVTIPEKGEATVTVERYGN